MRLLGVEASDFLSYHRLDVDLTDVRQLAIVGKNGHGKSAILDAILWCLFSKGRGSTDEMVREGAGSTYVRTTWERVLNDGVSTVVITRSRSRESEESSLSVTVDGVDRTKSKIPLTQALIEHLVGMGPKAMMAGPIMVQGDSAALLEAQPSARKDLLVELFKLDRWESYHEEAKRRRKALAAMQDRMHQQLIDMDERLADYDALQVQRELAEWRQELAKETEELEALRERVTKLRETAAVLQERAKRAAALGLEMDDVNADLVGLQADEKRLINTMASNTEVAAQPIPHVPPEPATDALALLSERIGDVDAKRNEKQVALTVAAQLRRQMEALYERAKSLSPCEGDPPGCQFVLAAAEASREYAEVHAKVAALEVGATGMSDLVGELEDLRVRVTAEESRIRQARRAHYDAATKAATMTAQRDAAVAFLARADGELASIRDRIARANERHARLSKERLALHQDQWETEDLTQRIQEVTLLGSAAKERIEELVKAITTTERFRDETERVLASRSKLLDEVSGIEEQAGLLDMLVKAFHRDGIPTLILETALPEIESRANDVLGRLPDDYSIRLDTKAATKAGTFKDELRVTVMTGGKERAYHMLSGGQRFRVDFAMRIALAAVIASRVEATVDTLWLDEPLGPLDREGQEAVADTLSAVAEDFGLIAVVSHVSDFNDRFESKLFVTMDEGESTAVLA